MRILIDLSPCVFPRFSETPKGPPAICVGERWRRLLDALAEELVASPQDVGLVHVVPSAAAAVELIVRPPERPAARAHG